LEYGRLRKKRGSPNKSTDQEVLHPVKVSTRTRQKEEERRRKGGGREENNTCYNLYL
jgi:hypothetical protein